MVLAIAIVWTGDAIMPFAQNKNCSEVNRGRKAPYLRTSKETVLARASVQLCLGLSLQQIAHRLVIFVEAENSFAVAA